VLTLLSPLASTASPGPGWPLCDYVSDARMTA
jgi:hypothetical protein